MATSMEDREIDRSDLERNTVGPLYGRPDAGFNGCRSKSKIAPGEAEALTV
jgi:hypothetical protein